MDLTLIVTMYILSELQKAGSMDSAEPIFFQTFRHICPVFRQIFILKIPFSQHVNDANYVNIM